MYMWSMKPDTLLSQADKGVGENGDGCVGYP